MTTIRPSAPKYDTTTRYYKSTMLLQITTEYYTCPKGSQVLHYYSVLLRILCYYKVLLSTVLLQCTPKYGGTTKDSQVLCYYKVLLSTALRHSPPENCTATGFSEGTATTFSQVLHCYRVFLSTALLQNTPKHCTATKYSKVKYCIPTKVLLSSMLLSTPRYYTTTKYT